MISLILASAYFETLSCDGKSLFSIFDYCICRLLQILIFIWFIKTAKENIIWLKILCRNQFAQETFSFSKQSSLYNEENCFEYSIFENMCKIKTLPAWPCTKFETLLRNITNIINCPSWTEIYCKSTIYIAYGVSMWPND